MLSEFPGVRYFPDLSYKIIVTISLAFSVLPALSVLYNIFPGKREQIAQIHANRFLLASTNPSRDT